MVRKGIKREKKRKIIRLALSCQEKRLKDEEQSAHLLEIPQKTIIKDTFYNNN